MKHLEEEDIARIIEGNVDEDEREKYMKHISRCETCFEIYSETLKYAEEEKKEPREVVLPQPGAIVRRIFQSARDARNAMTRKYVRPVFAVLILIFVLIPFLIIQNPI